ncbi:MAG: hypothetical protein KKB50_13770 [Planctomycetes bacterium]|nr:hypothetical protein [Planctomycetota bacterium]
MAALQNVVARAASQLREMSISQRIAVTLGAVLVALALVSLAHWAASPEMVPLLDQDL